MKIIALSNSIHQARILIFMYRLLVFLFIFSCLACKKESWNDDGLQQIALPFTGAGKLYDVHVDADARIHIVGGQRLERNDFFQSNNHGLHWQVQHFDAVEYSNKAIFCFAESERFLFGGSFDGKVFRAAKSDQPEWKLFLGDFWWYSFTGMHFNAQNQALIAANNGFEHGLIVRVDEDLNVLQVDSFPFAINDVYFADEHTAFAVGYGAVLRSSDGGRSWRQLQLTDDNYRAITITENNTIWIVGFNGTIAKSTDHGNSFTKVKNGQNPFSNTDRYIDVAFKGQRGYIVGEKGVVLSTEDGGAHWQRMKRFTREDLRAVCFHPHRSTAYFAGSNNVAFSYEY
ncbi:MAG TPA: YCF48-related protein [Edaphocola sp.]|nr:YCF48-related protein [Edaphocola sp.]